jgi:hypothetical protein
MTLRLFVIVSCVVAVAGLLSLRAGGSPEQQKQRLRVGVYDSRAVAIAAVRGGVAADKVRQLHQQLAEAEAAGDEKLAAQIKKRGEALQTVRHLQAFSNAPVDDILIDLKDRLPALAADAQVDLIVARVDFAAEGVEVVDLTDRLVAEFKPDRQTTQILASMHGKKPLEMVEVLMGDD